MSLKNCNDIIGNRTRDLPVCRVMPYNLVLIIIIITIIIIIITYLVTYLLAHSLTHSPTHSLTYLFTAIELSLGGSSPYTSTDKTNKNEYT